MVFSAVGLHIYGKYVTYILLSADYRVCSVEWLCLSINSQFSSPFKHKLTIQCTVLQWK